MQSSTEGMGFKSGIMGGALAVGRGLHFKARRSSCLRIFLITSSSSIKAIIVLVRVNSEVESVVGRKLIVAYKMKPIIITPFTNQGEVLEQFGFCSSTREV